MMNKRLPAMESGSENRGEYTFGHNLLTVENIHRLSEQASHWAVIMNYNEEDEEFIAAGYTYRAITDKEDAKGFPPAAWLRPPVVASRDDAEAMTTAALEGATPAALQRAPATDPIRLFYAARSWGVINQFHMTAISAKLDVGRTPAAMYDKYCAGQLSEYTLVVGLTEESPPSNIWIPPGVLMTLGSLLYMHGHGRPYLPLTLFELREIRKAGVMAVSVRPDARPMTLPPGVWPVIEQQAPPPPPGLEAEPQRPRTAAIVGGEGLALAPSSRGAGRAGAGGAGSGGGGSGGGSGSGATSRHGSRAELASAPQGSSTESAGRQAGTAAAAAAAPSAAARAGVGGSTASAEAGAMPRPPDPEPDPILNSANWIMPKPFDTPMPIPPSASSEALDGGGDAGGGGGAEAGGDAPHAIGGSELRSSPFLQANSGVQPTYETPPLRLFLGERGQYGLSANWWYVDAATNAIHGPFSPEAMLLSFITHCREIRDDTLVCGSDADVRLPMQPPLSAFLPLGELLRDITDGAYVLVSRKDIIVPALHRGGLANRIRPPQPAAAHLVPVATRPVVVALQPHAHVQQPQSAQNQQQGQHQHQQQGQGQPPVAQPVPSPITVQVLQPVVQGQGLPQSQPPQPHVPVFQAQIQPQPQPGAPAAQTAQAAGAAAPPPMQPPQQPAHQQHYYPPPQVPPQGQPAAPAYAPLGASVAAQNAVRGLPLPHLMAVRPRPAATPGVAAAPVPAYTLPGSMVYMPQYGQPMPYSGHSVMAQPVLAGAQQSQQAMPAQQQ